MKTNQSRTSPVWLDGLPLIIVLAGLVLRLIQFAFNRSIWIDEAWITQNILSRSFSQLLEPLDYGQGAPVGFLFGIKALTLVFGSSEYVLRTLPLVSGCLALLVFWLICGRVLDFGPMLLALSLFSFAHPLIYYASEVKQYSGDVFMTTLILLGALFIWQQKQFSWPAVVGLAIGGAIIVWCSHASVFVLGGALGSGILLSLVEKRLALTSRLVFISLACAISFFLLYRVQLATLTSSTGLIGFWKTEFDAFMPFPPKSTADLQWFMATYLKMFGSTAGVGATIRQLAGVGGLLFAFGTVKFFFKNRFLFFFIVFVFILTLFASGLQRYPFADRLILFLVPFLILGIAESSSLFRFDSHMGNAFLGIVLCVFVLWEPITKATNLTFKRQEIRPAIEYIVRYRQPGDFLYVNGATRAAFEYYAPRYRIDSAMYLIGPYPEDMAVMKKEIVALRDKKRIWVLFSNWESTAFLTFLQQHAQVDVRHPSTSVDGLYYALYIF